MSQNNDSLYNFFGVAAPVEASLRGQSDAEMNGKLQGMMDGLATLYELIPDGQAVSFRVKHGRIVLATPDGDARGSRTGQMIVMKPKGVLELSAQMDT